MNKFQVLDVTRALGVAPSTGSIIAGLLNGQVNPDNCRSIEYWPMEALEAPPQGMKVLSAIAGLLDDGCDVRQCKTVKGDAWYIEWPYGPPTVIWYVNGNEFVLGGIGELL